MKPINTILLSVLLSLSSSAFAAKININNADAITIAMEIAGIGESRAQAIVDYRKVNGRFKSIDDLSNVKGVGIKTIEKNRSNITL